MKIINLFVENFMKLVAVEITPDGNTVMITGKNGAGKSCVLDAIISALCGKKYIPQKPIRGDEDHAEIRIETDNYIIKRTFTKDGGGTLSITNAEGMQAKSPQELLSKIVGEIAFNPGKFIRLGEDEKGRREQREILMKLAGLDFSDIDKELEEIKEQRSMAKYNKEHAEQNLAPAENGDSNLPTEPVSIEELTEKLKLCNQHNNELVILNGQISDASNRTTNAEQVLANIAKDIESHEKELAKLRRDYITAEKQITVCEKAQAEIAKKLEPRIDTDAIQAEINKAHTTNRLIEDKHRRILLLAEVETARKEFSDLGKKIQDVEGKKSKRLAEAEMPIPDLGINDNGITYKGLPFSQTNSAKQLEIAVAISMALNPKLRVIIMDGNALDSDSMATIQKMVKDKDYQVWIEKASDDESVGIYIEDGNVKK